MTRFALLASGLVLAVLAACVSSETQTPADGTADSGGVPNPTTDGSPGDDDGAAPIDDAGAVTITGDGGENIDPDAGFDDSDPDAGIPADGGVVLDGGIVACNATNVTSAAVTTKCAYQVAALSSGGALVSGTYKLTEVTVIGTQAFCAGQFTPTTVSGALSMIARAGSTSFTAQRATMYSGALAPTRRTESYTPAAGNKSPMNIETSCPTNIVDKSSFYQSYVQNNVQHLIVMLPFGRTGQALYHYEK